MEPIPSTPRGTAPDVQAPGLQSVAPAPALYRSGPHYPALDALRFVLALWVMMSHVHPTPLPAGTAESPVLYFLSHAWATVVFGVPAVMAFFVISGFCIHLPFRSTERLPLGRYYARRYIRVVLPCLAALPLFVAVSPNRTLLSTTSLLWRSALWSLLCEEIYYALYPALLWARRRYGWAPLLCVSFVVSPLLAIRHFHSMGWYDLGPWSTAAILYPVWILGCVLAEQVERLSGAVSHWEIWGWRGVVWGASWACEMLHFHGGVSYTQTLAGFGILCFFWIRKELLYARHQQPSKWLILGGAWSYSLYLTNWPMISIFKRSLIPAADSFPNRLACYGFVLATAYVFFLLVERPLHRIARRVGAMPRSAVQPATP